MGKRREGHAKRNASKTGCIKPGVNWAADKGEMYFPHCCESYQSIQ